MQDRAEYCGLCYGKLWHGLPSQAMIWHGWHGLHAMLWHGWHGLHAMLWHGWHGLHAMLWHGWHGLHAMLWHGWHGIPIAGLEFRDSGFQRFRISEIQDFRDSGFQRFRISEIQDFRDSGFQGIGAVPSLRSPKNYIFAFENVSCFSVSRRAANGTR